MDCIKRFGEVRDLKFNANNSTLGGALLFLMGPLSMEACGSVPVSLGGTGTSFIAEAELPYTTKKSDVVSHFFGRLHGAFYVYYFLLLWKSS